MVTAIRIPDEINVMQERLSGLETLLVTKKWERAAVVYAFTEIGGPRDSTPIPPPRMNIRHFVDLGITGLTTQKSVQRYRRAWEEAIAKGWAEHVEPGDDDVALPEEPFPAWPFGALDVAEAIKDNPEAASAARHALKTVPKKPGAPRQDRWDSPDDYNALVALDRALKLVERTHDTVKQEKLDDSQREEIIVRSDAITKAVQALLSALVPEKTNVITLVET